jgi:hypothetical protein
MLLLSATGTIASLIFLIVGFNVDVELELRIIKILFAIMFVTGFRQTYSWKNSLPISGTGSYGGECFADVRVGCGFHFGFFWYQCSSQV